MGILDSILGMNTSSGTQAAAQQAQSDLDATNQSNARILRNTTGQADTALTTNTQSGLGALNSGYGSAIGALLSGGQQAQGQLATGVNDATSTVLGGNANFAPYLSGGQGATSMLSNALGLNGASGNAAATSAFQTSPGYQFQLDQATGATERAAAAAGGLGSGSTLSAILNQSSNLANQEYGSWLSNLSGLGAQGLTAANSISANNQTAGGYQYGGGATGAQLTQTTGQNVGNAYVGQGTGQAGLYGTLGQGLSNNLTGEGQNIANSSTSLTEAAANAGLAGGAAQDQASNANSGILSKLLGGIAGIPFGGTSLSGASTGGFNITPGQNGGFSISPTSSGASSGGSGLFGPSINAVGKQIASYL